MTTRPERVTRAPKAVSHKRRVRDVIGNLSAKHLAALEDNPKLNDCCRKPKDHMVQLFKTHDDAPGPDLMVLECGTCARKHYRLVVGGGQQIV